MRKLIHFSLFSFLEEYLNETRQGIVFQKNNRIVMVLKGIEGGKAREATEEICAESLKATGHTAFFVIGDAVRSMGEIPGMFGGIILGCIVGYVFNRTSQKSFNGAAQIFSGVRFTFLIMIFVSILFGAADNVVWPWAQKGISALAGVIKNSGTFGLFLYGFLERLLVPTGLHHLVYTPFQFSDLGGVLQVGDNTVVGAYAIAMTELNMPVEKMSESIYYMAIGFTKMFGYIGIGAAFMHTAYKENKKRVRSTMIPLIVTACLASITEPIDFMFIFCAPVLFVIHAVIAGLFLALLKVFGVTAFCGGNILSSFITNMAAGTEKTNWPMMYVLAAIQIVLYFVVFSILIKKMDLKTPGREAAAAEEEGEAGGAQPKNTSLTANVASLVEGLGGKDNINSTENCFTRLRVNVKDPSLLKDELINKVPNSGIVKKEDDIQIIIGLKVAEVRTAVEDYLKSL